MYKKINSKNNADILNKKKDNDRVIIIYHWNSCGHCHSLMSMLYNLLMQDQDLIKTSNLFEVEYDNFKFLPEDLRNVSAFPSIVCINKGKKVNEFNEQRTPENLSKFIKANSSLKSKVKPIAKPKPKSKAKDKKK